MKASMIFILILTLIIPSYAYSARDNKEAAPDAPAGEQTKSKTLKGHSEEVLTVALSPDGQTLASGGEDEIVILWGLSAGEKLKTLKGHSDHVTSLSFSPDGQTLASGSKDKTIILWNVASGEKVKTLKGHRDNVMSLAFSPDGQTLASGSADEKIIFWSPESGEKLKTLKGHSDEVFSIAFSPDGQMLASGSSDENIILWNVSTGENIRTLKGHKDPVITLAFSPDGQTLASGSSDKTIALWNIFSGEKIKTLTDDKNIAGSVAFSPDGEVLFSGSNDKTVAVWDVQTGKKLKTLTGHTDVVTSVVLSGDGRFLVSGSEDRNIIVWDISGKGFAASHAVEARPAQRPSVKGPEIKAPVTVAPELVYDVKVEDTNGNGILEGGEIISVNVNIENKGKGAAQGVEVLLSGNNTLTSCLGNKNIAGSIEPNGKKKVTFKCALPTRIKHETAQFSVELDEERGYAPVELKSFTVAVRPAEIKETTQELSRFIDVDMVPSKLSSYKKENSYAVIIGISRYREDMIPQVKYAESDAQTVAKYIENIGGVPKQNIKVLTNEKGTLGDLTSYFEEWLPRRVNKNSEIFIYYAGHGAPDPDNNKEAYIVPYDGHPDYKSKMYPLKRMYDALNKLPSEKIIVMLDSCFSGAGERSVAREGSRPISISVENPVLAGGKVAVLAAASGTQISSDYDKVKHGLFTYYLLKGMRGDADSDKDGKVSLAELYDYIKENVSRTASIELNRDQTPVLLPEQDGHRKMDVTRVK
ncbi:MAG: caspase family protein [Nitrospirae bacterium]|nr:caspase family protein [Nitrospirota bacterium]